MVTFLNRTNLVVHPDFVEEAKELDVIYIGRPWLFAERGVQNRLFFFSDNPEKVVT